MGQQRCDVLPLRSEVVGVQVEVGRTIASHNNSTQPVEGSETRHCLVWLTPVYGAVEPQES